MISRKHGSTRRGKLDMVWLRHISMAQQSVGILRQAT